MSRVARAMEDRTYKLWRDGIVTGTCVGAVGIANIIAGYSTWWLLLVIPILLWSFTCLALAAWLTFTKTGDT